MNTTINISQEVIEQLVQQEVQKQIESKVNETLTQEFIQRSVRAIVTKSLDLTVVERFISEVLDNQFKEPQSYLNSNITTKIDRFVSEWLTNNKWKLEQQVSSGLSAVVKSSEVYDKYIEPHLVKCIAADTSFIPYVKQEVHNKLNEKIKSFNKVVGTNISTSLVQEFLRNYISNRGLDDENTDEPESKN